MYRAITVCLRTTSDRVVGHVFSTVLTGSVNWLWSGERVMRVKRWETDFQIKDEGRRRMGGIQEKNVKGDQGEVEEDAITDEGREECREGVEDHGPGYLCWDVLVMKLLRSILRWRSPTWWWHSSAWWGMRADPINVSRWKHKWCFHNVGVVSDTPMARWAGEGKDSAQEMFQNVRPRKMR